LNLKTEWDGIQADVVYTYRKRGLEQDVILRQSPALPKDFAADTTLLVVVTEFIAPPDPQKTEVVLKKEDDATLRALMAVPDLINEDLNFGAMQMLLGRAFVSDVPRTDPSQPMIPIAKHWLSTPDRRTFLTEAVEFASIQNLLKGFAQAPAPKSK